MSALTILKLRRFARNKRGVSAVEFALLSPMMIGLYLGCVEISEGISVDRKVTLAAGAVANLAAQKQALSTTEMTNVLDATTTVMAPYSASPMKITLTCINIDANKVAKVKWSVARNGTAYSEGSTISIPSALAVPGSLVLGEVSYTYTPTIGHVITGSLDLSDKMYMAPRISPPTYETNPPKPCT
jgi:Flp pilus assembly protein TadG